MLVLNNVKKLYKDIRAVDGLSFQVDRGQILGLIGANGDGKSTTISMIATLVKPDEGIILYDGCDIVKNPSYLRNKLGYVPQEIALYPNLSGKDNLLFWGRANRIKGKTLIQRMKEISDLLNLSEDLLRRKVGTYSGGYQRRLNIGAALLHNPNLVIMDEPTVGLDIETRNHILTTVFELKKRGTTVIYTSHYMDEIEKLSDKICIIDKGKCILFGDKNDLITDDNKLEQIYLDITAIQKNG